MRRMRDLPPQEVLHEWFDYDRATGSFVWRKSPTIRVRAGMVAGNIRPTGYVLIGVPGFRQLMAHRLAWIYVNGGQLGSAEIDHRDGNPSNNAIANLRIATSSQQKRNKRVQSNNRCGLKGAMYHAAHKGTKKWRSQIRVDGKMIFLGYFHTPQEAHSAYRRAAFEHFGEFATVRSAPAVRQVERLIGEDAGFAESVADCEARL